MAQATKPPTGNAAVIAGLQAELARAQARLARQQAAVAAGHTPSGYAHTQAWLGLVQRKLAAAKAGQVLVKGARVPPLPTK